MSGQEGGFRQAAARFSAEVDQALTTARRAAREARAESAEFRRRNEELAGQAKKGKLHGLRRGEVAATTDDARAEAVKFRTDNGLPVPELPTAAALLAALPDRDPVPVARKEPENDDFSANLVMVDVDESLPRETVPEQGAGEPAEVAPNPPEAPADTLPSDAEEDFSQQRILMDATVESYRPTRTRDLPDDLPESENRR